MTAHPHRTRNYTASCPGCGGMISVIVNGEGVVASAHCERCKAPAAVTAELGIELGPDNPWMLHIIPPAPEHPPETESP